MKMNRHLIRAAMAGPIMLTMGTGHAETITAGPPDSYNVVWDTQSENSAESMPCGGGDIGMNVWVEDGEVLFYMQRSGSLAETNEYLKLGRVRLRLDPNPFAAPDAGFRQKLTLREGHVEVRGSTVAADGRRLDATVRIWAEVRRPIIHMEVESGQAIHANASYENWRLEDEMIPHNDRRRSFFTLAKYPGEVKLHKDTVEHVPAGVLFHHRNRTFGGLMTGPGFRAAGESEGKYQTATHKAWMLRSEKPARRHHLRVVTHIAQAETPAAWQQGLQATVDASADDLEAARKETTDWWTGFWNRSWIVIHPDKPDPSDKAWRAARNYNLFRYQLGCNAFGEYPSKFNGGNFTFDANRRRRNPPPSGMAEGMAEGMGRRFQAACPAPNDRRGPGPERETGHRERDSRIPPERPRHHGCPVVACPGLVHLRRASLLLHSLVHSA